MNQIERGYFLAYESAESHIRGGVKEGDQLQSKGSGPHRIYIGGLDVAQDLELLKKLQIDVIINCTYTSSCFFKNEFQYFRLPLSDDDSQELGLVFSRGVEYLQFGCINKTVLVHCKLGVSRSVTVVLAWMIKYHEYSLCQAIKDLRKRHEAASPNIGFMQQLSEFSSRLRGNNEYELQSCKICSCVIFAEDSCQFTQCGHSICLKCENKEKDLLFCPHCRAEMELRKQLKPRMSNHVSGGKDVIKRSEVLPLVM